MKYRMVILLAAVGLAAGLGHEARATIIGGGVTGGTSLGQGGTFMKLSPPLSNPYGTPNSVGNNTFQDPNLYGFDEDQNVLVNAGGLIVDIIAGGGSGTIAGGTEVASHYIFFDPNASTTQQGYVAFDSDILAIITSTTRLAASDYLANTGINYLNPGLRGLEGGDFAWIDPLNDNVVLVDWTASTPGDYIRVLTAHSPGAVPDAGSTLFIFSLGMAALGGIRRLSRF